MFRFVAPAGAPLEISQILHSVGLAASRNRTAEECYETFASRLKVRHVLGISSGRAALSLILEGIHRLRPDRSVVAVPAYTCFTVAASVVRAGLKIYPVDVNPETLDLDPSQLEALPQEQLLCILTSNLFGFVNEASHLREAAGAKGAFLVDDAAQALGSTRNGQQAGMLGDVGFYSFGRGKALATVEGAVIVTNSTEIASTIQSLEEKLPASPAGHSAWLVFQMLVYAVFLHPRLYWIPDSLPFLGLGTTEFAPDFRTFSLPRVVQGLLPQLMDRLQEMNRMRRENSVYLAQALQGSPRFTIPRPGPDCQPNYVRFPLIARDRATRDQAVKRLRSAGIGASTFYPSAICDIPGIDRYMATADFHCPRAEDLSRRLLTLPIHPFVRGGDLRRMIAVLNDVQFVAQTREA